MKYWLTADTHFNHKVMEEYCGRPKDFESKILEGLDKIPVTDILIHLGDICIGKDEGVHDLFIKNIRCRKWLIKGNHDRKSNNWYLSRHWDFVADTFSITLFAKKILFSHTPQKDNGFDLNIHGHFHNQLPRLLKKRWVVEDEEERNKYDISVLTPKHKLLALEYTNYQPVSLESFINQSNKHYQ